MELVPLNAYHQIILLNITSKIKQVDDIKNLHLFFYLFFVIIYIENKERMCIIMGKRANGFVISDMYCTKCGQKGIGIPRKFGQYRGPGHLKKLYCIHCGEMWNHAEVRSMYSDYNLEDFQLEMKYHNFDEHGNRKEPYRIFRGKLKQQGVI